VTGAIAIFRLLPQKVGLEEVDRELFELLATHAATALYCTQLHEQLAQAAAG
jgi:GAF domain-containing protein